MGVKWQCTQCGTTQTTMGLRPVTGGFCGKTADHKHRWTKVSEGLMKWQCKECGSTQATNGLRPSVGGFCGKTKDHKHRWVKI